MNYAEKILRKYGWQEGKGLGKGGKGIVKPIKNSLKFDKSGIGYSEKGIEEENDQWWIKVYDKTASNLTVTKEKMSNRLTEVSIQSAMTSSTSAEESSNDCVWDNVLTDEQLFKACGGRTAHKAARHGLKLSGKLKRIMQQEAEASSVTTHPNEKPKHIQWNKAAFIDQNSVHSERGRKQSETKILNKLAKKQKSLSNTLSINYDQKIASSCVISHSQNSKSSNEHVPSNVLQKLSHDEDQSFKLKKKKRENKEKKQKEKI